MATEQEIKKLLAKTLIGAPKDVSEALIALDPTPDYEFAVYLGRLYRQSDPAERRRLLTEDGGKARAYLWAAKALQSWQVSIRLNDGTGEHKRALALPDVLGQLEPHLPLLRDLPLSAEAQHWLGDAIAGKVPEIEIATAMYNPEEQALIDNGDIEIIFDRGALKLYKIITHVGAQFVGRNTKWCTTEQNPGAFNGYNEDATLFALVVRNTTDKYQFHFGECQFCDARDEGILYSNLLANLPVSVGVKSEFTRTLSAAVVEDSCQRVRMYSLADLGPLNTDVSTGILELAKKIINQKDQDQIDRVCRYLPFMMANLPDLQRDEAFELLVGLAAQNGPKTAEKIIDPMSWCLHEYDDILLQKSLQFFRSWVEGNPKAMKLMVFDSLLSEIRSLNVVGRQQALALILDIGDEVTSVADPADFPSHKFKSKNKFWDHSFQEIMAFDLIEQLAESNPLRRLTIIFFLAEAAEMYKQPLQSQALDAIGRLTRDDDIDVKRFATHMIVYHFINFAEPVKEHALSWLVHMTGDEDENIKYYLKSFVPPEDKKRLQTLASKLTDTKNVSLNPMPPGETNRGSFAPAPG